MPIQPAAVERLVDLVPVLAGSGLEDEFLARAQAVQVGSVALPVIEVSDLIIAKVLAGRPKDIDDARALCTTRADSVDESRIREVLRLLEEALAQSDLLTTFERLRPGSR